MQQRFEMQRPYEEQPLSYSGVSENRYSRKYAIYHARVDQDWEKRIFSNRRRKRSYRGGAPRAASSFWMGAQTRALLPKLLLALAAICVVVVAYCALSNGADATDEPVSTQPANKSTDRSQWIKGRMPYLYQTDSEWASVSYAGETVGDSGCGPTCLSMVYVYLTGKKDKDPTQMAAFSESNDYIECGMTTWTFMSEGARKLGLRSQELSADESVIRSQLKNGHPIIASVSKGDFTTQGHFIVLESTDAFGRIMVRDPNSPERSAQAWDLSRILAQTRNLWVFSV